MNGVTASSSPSSLTLFQTNDPPVVGAPIADQSTFEDAPFSFIVPAATFVDPNPWDATLSYSASLDGGGALPPWLTFNAATVSFSGTPTNDDVGTVSIQVTAADSFGKTASDVFDLTVINTNDPPVIGGTVAGQAITDEMVASPFAVVTITDVDVGDIDTATVTLSPAANGDLSNLGGGSYDSGTGIYTVSGTPAAVQAALRGLVFTPTQNEVTPGLTVTTGFGLAVDDGTVTVSDATASVVATSVNDAPAISGTTAGQATTDYVPIKPFVTVTVSAVDVGVQDSLTITLKDGIGNPTDANGLLSGAGLTKTSTGTYSFAATSPRALTSELRALTFTPTQHEVPAGQTVTTSFVLTASQTAGGSTTTTTDSTTSVIATALNYVNGPASGLGLLVGTPSQDIITAHGILNAIFGRGGPDVINAGDGLAFVDVGSGDATVTLGGALNVVIGGNGNVAVTGAPGGLTSVTLGNGNNVVSIGGQNDIIILGNGTNTVSGTRGMAFIRTGSGNDTIMVDGPPIPSMRVGVRTTSSAARGTSASCCRRPVRGSI